MWVLVRIECTGFHIIEFLQSHAHSGELEQRELAKGATSLGNLYENNS